MMMMIPGLDCVLVCVCVCVLLLVCLLLAGRYPAPSAFYPAWTYSSFFGCQCFIYVYSTTLYLYFERWEDIILFNWVVYREDD